MQNIHMVNIPTLSKIHQSTFSSFHCINSRPLLIDIIVQSISYRHTLYICGSLITFLTKCFSPCVLCMGRIISTNSKEIYTAHVLQQLQQVAHFAFVSSTNYVIVLFATSYKNKLLWSKYARWEKFICFCGGIANENIRVIFHIRKWFT